MINPIIVCNIVEIVESVCKIYIDLTFNILCFALRIRNSDRYGCFSAASGGYISVWIYISDKAVA